MKDDSKPLASSSWQGFVYHSEPTPTLNTSPELAQAAVCDLSEGPENAATPTFSLSSRRPGDRLRIASLNCGDTNNRLMAMGIMPGAVLEIISGTATGSVIVALQDQRLGLDADMASKIQVVGAAQQLATKSDTSTVEMTPLQPPSQECNIKLRDVEVGAVLRVVGYEPMARDYKRKLLAMGLIPGTQIKVTRHAPLGDPTEIAIRGFQLSLRKAEADALIVEPVTQN